MSIYDNIAYGPRTHGVRRKDLAIIIPPARKDKIVAALVAISFALSFACTYLPGTKEPAPARMIGTPENAPPRSSGIATA